MNPNLVDQSSTAVLFERIKQRTDEMTQRAVERRQEKKSQEVTSESVDYFYQRFQNMKDDLERKLEEGENIGMAQTGEYLDDLVRSVQQVQQLLNESHIFLASFQVKKAQENIRDLDEQVQAKIALMQPKKKFGFGRKKPSKTVKAKEFKKEDNVDANAIDNKNSLEEIIGKNFFGFKDQRNVTLTKTADEVENRQLNLVNLDNCRVVVHGCPSTLQFASLTNCTVMVGPTSRSGFIKDCVNCKFIIACQQLRIHDTKNTDFYLHVTGAAIIENCDRVRFAPYNLSYPDIKEHYSRSGLDLSINQWDKVEDFRWLNENEKSPNWCVIPESERRDSWI